MINGVGDILAHHLLESLGNEEAIFTEKKSQLEKINKSKNLCAMLLL